MQILLVQLEKYILKKDLDLLVRLILLHQVISASVPCINGHFICGRWPTVFKIMDVAIRTQSLSQEGRGDSFYAEGIDNHFTQDCRILLLKTLQIC